MLKKETKFYFFININKNKMKLKLIYKVLIKMNLMNKKMKMIMNKL